MAYALILGTLVAATSAALRRWPGLSRTVLSGEKRRKHALDGMRGVLALSV